MAEIQEQIRTMEKSAQSVVTPVAPWIASAARVGYASRGVVYLLAGALAFLAAFKYSAGRTTSPTTAITTLLDHPFGWIALSFIAAGLFCYSLWCFVQAIADPEYRGTHRQGLFKRFGILSRGFGNLGLVAIAVGTLTGILHSSRHDPVEQWTARLMAWPAGALVVAIIGGCVLGNGVKQIYCCFSTKTLDDHLDLSAVPKFFHLLFTSLGRLGSFARGVTFCLVGFFMLHAAYDANPHEAKGIGHSLHFIETQPEGKWLLAAIASGLIAYGLFQLVLSACRRIQPAR